MITRFQRTSLAWLAALLLAGCALPAITSRPTPPPTATPAVLAPTATAIPSPQPTGAPTVTPQPSSTPTVAPPPTPTDIPLTATPTLEPLSESQRLQLFDEVWESVRDRYVYTDYRGVDWNAVREQIRPQVASATTEEAYALIAGMIDQLGDEHSRFDTPQQVAEDEARATGNRSYVGIGVILRDDPRGGLIVRVAHGGPAEEAGIRARDVIAAVNGIPYTDTERFGPDGARGVIRASTDVDAELTIVSPDGSARPVRVRSRVIPTDALPAVEASLVPGTNVGLLFIDDFQLDDLDSLILDSLDRLTAQGPLDGLIIDVRTNLGGYVYQMENTIGFFVDGGTIGSTKGRRQSIEIEIPSGRRFEALNGTPIVVLISDETASAGEMFASGMQTLKRATIIGTPSSGNTENLRGMDFFDGSRLWLAELVFSRPDGSTIEDVGVQPDRVVPAEWWQYTTADDPQIKAALEEIQRIASSGR